ncbi:MAG: GntR family transcriptional regulator [Emergencia sp.]
MKEKLGTTIYQNVKRDILSGAYPSSTILTEGEIAARFSVSKAPVKSALHRLCDEGYLISYARKGYLVCNTSEEDFCRIQQLRYAIEGFNVAYLIKFASEDQINELQKISDLSVPSDMRYTTVNAQFHMAMADLTGNKYVVSTLSALFAELEQLSPYINTKNLPIEEQTHHDELLRSILNKDLSAALTWLKKDIEEKHKDERLDILEFQ